MRGCVLYEACRRVIGPSLSLSGWSWTILRPWQVRPKHKIVWGAILGVPSNQNKLSDFNASGWLLYNAETAFNNNGSAIGPVCLDDPGPFLVSGRGKSDAAVVLASGGVIAPALCRALPDAVALGRQRCRHGPQDAAPDRCRRTRNAAQWNRNKVYSTNFTVLTPGLLRNEQ